MVELIALAIQTDSTRAVTLSSGFVNGDFGLSGGYHGFSHHGEREKETQALMKIEGYQVSMIGYLMDLLKAQEDPINGGTLLDHTMLLYGCGMATGTPLDQKPPAPIGGRRLQAWRPQSLPRRKEQTHPCRKPALVDGAELRNGN